MTLTEILRRLRTSAKLNPGLPARHKLAGGLVISVKVVDDGDLLLQLSREGTSPSRQEWETVLRKWPVPLAQVPPPNGFLLGKVEKGDVQ